ncbi:MAG: hypothetical protein EI684_14645 [Candidatus Viridilinea halotolerans]|uniref:Uncharacterized protein n=1 Tax=Candidatus Viridilinea halotolerans TaxID=2491704 RepID=A0A426TWA7_9CHLR|nr:MAG: hypothetical protein EI684_14645 [Candidatus Viridilinea halotolerans]
MAHSHEDEAPPPRHQAIVDRLAVWYDLLAAPSRLHAAERMVATFAMWGLIIHLVLIAAAQVIGGQLADLVGTTWLAAIYTPFAFILIYEVLLLILAIPESTTRALALQFQIISLIVIRNSFKDLAYLDHLTDLLVDRQAQIALAADMGGGVLLFGLVAIFYAVAGRPSSYQTALRMPTQALLRFIARKKAVAFIITLIFGALVVHTGGLLVYEAGLTLQGQAFTPQALGSPTTPLFERLFTILILADVLLLVLSLRLSDAYQHLFRGAGFVITTIVLRIALSADRPLQVVFAVAAVIFGIAVLAIYKAWPRDPWLEG